MPPTDRQLSADGDSVLIVRDLCKRFPQMRPWTEAIRRPFQRRQIQVLRGISLNVRAGEFVGLLGANGAGKTTLMKLIATLLIPDSGIARVGGFDTVQSGDEVRQRISMSLATERGLYWRLSAWENLRLFADLQNIHISERDDRIRSVLATVSLEESARRTVREFSSGMIQRLLIARALLPSPLLLMLDEPTRSLDPISARELRRFLREELAERRQCAVLLATHSADEAFHLCDRVAVMNRGLLVAEGDAGDLARRFVAPRYSVMTSEPEHQEFAALERTGELHVVQRTAGESGWTSVTLRLDGGDVAAARVLSRLVTAGVPVSSFTPDEVSLAELIETVTGAEVAA